MFWVLLPYGLIFVLLGGVIALQARSGPGLLPRRALWLLAAFGFTHGAAEWLVLAAQVGAAGPAGGSWQRPAQVALLFVSFGLLLQLGLELVLPAQKRWGWLKLVPGALALLGVGAAGALGLRAADADWRLAENLARHGLAFPGALLSAQGLWRTRGLLLGAQDRRRRRGFLGAASVALVTDGFLAGIVVARAEQPLASVLNTETVRQAIGVPVELLRAACAAMLAIALTEAFVIEAARAQAEAARRREEFVAFVAHDLRNAISTIGLSAQRIERLAPEAHGGEKEHAILKLISANGTSLARMVDDLLDASLVEVRRLKLRRERLDLLSLVRGAVERARALTAGRTVALELPTQLPALMGDPMRIEQVLMNLLSNAGKYSPPGAEISVTVRALPGEVEVSVSNPGPGIAPEAIGELFTRFHRTEEAERGAAGLGVGLYIARGVIEAHQGRIWVESRRGEQTTFFFTLPAPAQS